LFVSFEHLAVFSFLVQHYQ